MHYTDQKSEYILLHLHTKYIYIYLSKLKIQLCITGINYILKYIDTENCYFKLQNYITLLLCCFFIH